MKIIFLIYIIIIILIMIMIDNKSNFINCITGCESLPPEFCLAAYPMCMSLILTSCCPGQSALCLEIDTVINYIANKKEQIQNCLRDRNNGILYELWGDMNEIPGFETIPIPNATCKDLNCESKGFDCIYESVADCKDSESLCCQPKPICTNFLKSINSKIIYGRIGCDLPCIDGYVCRIVNDVKTCLPSSCDIIQCEVGNECLALRGLGIVSCFKIIENITTTAIINKGDGEFEMLVGTDQNVLCSQSNITCPNGFECSNFNPYHSALCVPPKSFNFFDEIFECDRCPQGWICRKFGWSGVCIEFEKTTQSGEDTPNCFGGTCLSNQICNTTSAQCEFEPCDPNTCQDGMVCFQYHPSAPRICSAWEITPSIEFPGALPPFFESFLELEGKPS
ncbi:hypothetical protein RB653_002617 [Dictyostelium firmibasis]|uniref:DSCP-N domain-containing protein n=1 Tax=Dictyostelium firmibasis TaxID=79012 RepID=A0AAN7TY51_9MYCE